MTTPSQARKEAQSFTLDEMRRKNRPVPPIPESEIELVAEQKNLKDVPNIYLARQHAIFYLFKLFGSPERDTWRESRIVPLIMEKLSIPRHSYRSVIAVLNSIDNQESEEDFISFAPSYNKKGVCGVQAIIKDNDETANVIYRAVSNSMSDTMITFLVNVHRKELKQEIVSRSTVRNFILRSDLIDCSTRETTKQGSYDEDGAWAISRRVFAGQLKEEFRLGTLPLHCEEVLSSEFTPLHVDGYGSWDEKHLKQKVGVHTDIERRVRRTEDGAYSKDGTLPPKKKKMNLKYEQEARGLFGCCLVTSTSGETKAVRFRVFDYTNRLVVGFKRYEKEIEKELKDKKRTKVKKETVWTAGVGGYEGIYGDMWRQEVEKAVNKKICCVKELIDHMHRETKDAYGGTPMESRYKIFHDHLSSMWEEGAIAYMQTLGSPISFWDRVIKISGSNNHLVSKYYSDSLPGNSPENGRCTDSYCFADCMQIVHSNVALTAGYDDDDPRKFSLQTPKHCYSALIRAWDIVPDSRFITDIQGWPAVCDQIIAAKGTKVEGEGFRSGKRYIKLGGQTSSKEFRKRNRKATLQATPIHPDSVEGMNNILRLSEKDYEDFVDRRDREEAAALRIEIQEIVDRDLAEVVEDSCDDDEEEEG